MPRRIVITTEVRALLAELDTVFDRYGVLNEKLAPQSGVSDSEAVDSGAEREHLKRVLLGLAWQLNKASTGRKN